MFFFILFIVVFFFIFIIIIIKLSKSVSFLLIKLCDEVVCNVKHTHTHTHVDKVGEQNSLDFRTLVYLIPV